MPQTLQADTSPLEAVRQIVETAAVDRVFGEPITSDGLTLIPVARVTGGGGGGSGTGPAEDEPAVGGTGGGVGVSAKPVGVYAVKNGAVRWRPAVDINKIILGGQIVAVVALLTVRAIVKARRAMKPGRS